MTATPTQEMISRTPADLHIKARDRKFGLAEVLRRDWHSDDAFKTAFFNALSIQFPTGERFFIESVRHFAPEITNPKLAEDVKGFTHQEAVHSREHKVYNKALCRARGYDLEELEGPFRERLKWIKDNSAPLTRLTATVAFEHLTAILADGILENEDWLAGSDPDMAQVWRWHSIEEVEHKSVTWDVYQAMGGDPKRVRKALRAVTVQFFADTFRNMRVMLRDYEGSKLKLWLGGANFLFGATGILRKLIPAYFSFFAADFHPWKHDNRDLLENAIAVYGAPA